ncbi:hypothetical protein NQZ79_g5978 [Umbelopsis isabellina]|nr:hypothetical protein NQZ79_g5978 [Umbelopsis isabellina]
MDDPNRYKRLKVLRACDFCRKRKVKCDLPQPNSGTCSNCQRAQRSCTFSPIHGNEQTKELRTASENTIPKPSKNTSSLKPKGKPQASWVTEILQLQTISRNLLASYIWDVTSLSHENGKPNMESSSSLLGADCETMNIAAKTTEMMYLYNIYLLHYDPIFPTFGIADIDATRERIAQQSTSPVDKAILACSAAHLSKVENDNTALYYRAICRQLLISARAGAHKVAKSDTDQLFFLYSVCHLIVPDIQPDNQYLAQAVEKMSLKFQQNSKSTVVDIDGFPIDNETFAVRRLWIMFLLHFCNYPHSDVKELNMTNEVEASLLRDLHVEGGPHWQCSVSCKVMAGLLRLRLCIEQPLDKLAPRSHKSYGRMKATLENWRNSIPKVYQVIYQTMDQRKYISASASSLPSCTSPYNDFNRWVILSRFIYIGTYLLIMETQGDVTEVDSTLKLELVTAMIHCLETALLREDFRKAPFVICVRFILEDCTRCILVLLQEATQQLLLQRELHKDLINLILRSCQAIKLFIRTATINNKKENLSQLEDDVRNGSLLNKLETIRNSLYGSHDKDGGTQSLPLVSGSQTFQLPAAPSSAVTIPLFSTYEILFGTEPTEEHGPLPSNGCEEVDKYRSTEADTASCVTTDARAVNNDALEENSTDNSTHSVKVHARQLFIGNLPFRVRWQDLKDMFKKAGDVVRADVAIGYDNRSKGHGTVLFTTIQDAQHAVDLFHNYTWQGRVLEVREDRGYIDREANGGNQFRHRGHGGGLPKATSTRPIYVPGVHMNPLYINHAQTGPPHTSGRNQLFVGNIPFSCQWQDLKDLFRNAGNILRADIAQGQDGRSRGFGTVLYATIEDAQNAVEMYDGYEFHGRQLRVHFDKFAPVPPPLVPGQLLSNVHESQFKHPSQHQPPSYQSIMPISSQALPGIHSHQPQPQSRQYYPNGHPVGNMSISHQYQLPNAILHNPHSIIQSDRITGASPGYSQMDHADTLSSLLPGTTDGSLFGPSDVPIRTSSGIEDGRMSSFTEGAPWSPNSAAWDQRHLNGLYRQPANRSQPLQYPWQTYPHQQPFGYPSYMALPTSQPEYLSEPHIPNNLSDNVQNVDAVAMEMANLRFESTAGLSQDNMDNIPVDDLNVDLTPPAGMGGIGLNDPMWERQEGNWAPSLTSSFKL